MKTALVMHEACGRHDTGWNHPEHMGRLPAIVNALYRDTPALLDHVDQIEGVPITSGDVLRVHTEEMWLRFQKASELAIDRNQIVGLDHETLVSPASMEAALAGAGCVVTAVQRVLEGQNETAFALARPPGHHATADLSMGFCLINSVAIAARWLRANGVERILIIDWDVHHGNGTQDIFYADPSVYYFSMHQHPLYPGTGWPDERGAGAAEGTNLNVQLPAGTTGAQFRYAFEIALNDIIPSFQPEFVLVSAGFDCLRGDPLGGLAVDPEDLHALTRLLLDRVEGVARGRVVHALEGGYNPERMGQGVVAVMRAMAGLSA